MSAIHPTLKGHGHASGTEPGLSETVTQTHARYTKPKNRGGKKSMRDLRKKYRISGRTTLRANLMPASTSGRSDNHSNVNNINFQNEAESDTDADDESEGQLANTKGLDERDRRLAKVFAAALSDAIGNKVSRGSSSGASKRSKKKTKADIDHEDPEERSQFLVGLVVTSALAKETHR
jgi:hypothetical protein